MWWLTSYTGTSEPSTSWTPLNSDGRHQLRLKGLNRSTRAKSETAPSSPYTLPWFGDHTPNVSMPMTLNLNFIFPFLTRRLRCASSLAWLTSLVWYSPPSQGELWQDWAAVLKWKMLPRFLRPRHTLDTTTQQVAKHPTGSECDNKLSCEATFTTTALFPVDLLPQHLSNWTHPHQGLLTAPFPSSCHPLSELYNECSPQHI